MNRQEAIPKIIALFAEHGTNLTASEADRMIDLVGTMKRTIPTVDKPATTLYNWTFSVEPWFFSRSVIAATEREAHSKVWLSLSCVQQDNCAYLEFIDCVPVDPCAEVTMPVPYAIELEQRTPFDPDIWTQEELARGRAF